MVTAISKEAAGSLLTEEVRASIHLAVAQWLRSTVGVYEAQRRLIGLGVDPGEMLRRRRAEAADPALARILRFAVTVVITRGRVDALDRLRLAGRHDDGSLARAVILATAEAYTNTLLLESQAHRPIVDIDLDVGDY